MTIPSTHPHIAHWMPYFFGDSLEAIAKAKASGFAYIDQDCHITKDGVPVIKHWSKVRMDGFTYILDSHGKRVKHNLGRDIQIGDLDFETLSRLRQASGDYRYRRIIDHMHECKRQGITMCLEVKGDKAFEDPAIMHRIKHAQEAVGASVYVMTLQNIGHPLGRLRAAKQAGFETALLPRNAQPLDWDKNWSPYVDAVWGKWR